MRATGPRFAAGAWVLVLAVSTVSYWHEQALDHFAWHLAYGASAGIVAGALAGLVRRPRRQTPATWALWALAGYAYMVIPDLIWFAGLATTGEAWDHEAWMDVFLLHVSLDQFPHAWAGAPVAMAIAAASIWVHDRRPPPRRSQRSR